MSIFHTERFDDSHGVSVYVTLVVSLMLVGLIVSQDD